MTVNDFIKVINRDSIYDIDVIFKGELYVFRAAESIDVGELGEKTIIEIDFETVDFYDWNNAILYVK